ncbi:hypothetical protein J1N35_038184 [Gossypium stocksii]|uniref:Uncharacterized protein n=1 Tax=Gossypium stocksii TaxID=47602 RepID=A0A9D3ULX3_9ROSI|nr:hypothetical protein J1N35_038184 [Gossypium stocksii]
MVSISKATINDANLQLALPSRELPNEVVFLPHPLMAFSFFSWPMTTMAASSVTSLPRWKTKSTSATATSSLSPSSLALSLSS